MTDERKWGRCPRCLQPRPGKDDPGFGLSFAPPCEHCGYDFIPEPEPQLVVWVCPYCTKQYRAPGSHHVAGDDCATSCSHRAAGAASGVTQPKLVRIAVAPVEPFVPKPLPGAES